MIYVPESVSADIRQGDIFRDLARVDFSLDSVSIVGDSEIEASDWDSICSDPATTQIESVLPVTRVGGIVASQDCDAVRSEFVTLCEIVRFEDAEGKARSANSANSFQKIITQHSRLNQKWFYLPPDPMFGFQGKMAVDFRLPFRLKRTELETRKRLRIGRLNKIAGDHFRERIGEFFRRYAYDEWYALDREELDSYEREHGAVSRLPWQQ